MCGGYLVIFKGLATESFIKLQWVHEQHKLDLVVFCVFVCFFFVLRGGQKSGRVDLEGMESECEQGALYKIPN